MVDFPPSWGPSVVDKLRVHWTRGLSGAECAAAINKEFNTHYTRNAAISKLFRIGLIGNGRKRRRSIGTSHVVSRIDAVKTKQIIAARQTAIATAKAAIPVPIIENREEAPLTQRKTILELDNTHCRWPYGHPGEAGFFYCGAPDADVIEHRPYCAFHARIARGSQRRSASEAA